MTWIKNPIRSSVFYFSDLKTFLLKSLNVTFTIPDEEIRFCNTDLHGKDYHLVAANLKNLTELDKKLTESGVDKNMPTIFIAECVLVYIEKSDTDSLMKWITNKFKSVFFVNYEQVSCLTVEYVSLKLKQVLLALYKMLV